MKILIIISVLSIVTANDYMIWSKDKNSLNIPLTNLAYQEKSVVFAFKDFCLGKFSKYANAYNDNKKSTSSELIKNIKNSFYKTGFFDGILNNNEIKNLFYIQNWNEIEEKFKNFDTTNKDTNLNFIILNSDDVDDDNKRIKRVASSALENLDDIYEEQKPIITSKVPVILPKYEKDKTFDNSPCLFYLEGVTLIHHTKSKSMVYKSVTIDFTKNNINDKFSGSFDCNNITKSSKFNIKIVTEGTSDDESGITIPKGTNIEFEINIEGNGFYSWKVNSLTLKKATLSIEGKSYSVNSKKLLSQKGSNFLDIDGYYDYSFACSQTPAIFALSDVPDNYIGISLVGLQLQMHPGQVITNDDGQEIFYGFSNNVNDCIPTFTPGSWMGIIVSLICISILLFGYQMISHLSDAVKIRK
ncbi:BIG/ATPase V1 complex, subunit S1 family-containing protein [Strongyloides ratti]|uniref:BIG/ATPase V1 complex, subunit S1 family-containing protein n=1 Tax=Strongyloides ratti TaxID=34506 RepID=A0A090LIF7_STRRB|nr:BIG/ATPase V1 complex, subunit S1 family-containing protein [Strongyloides ratti]CEF67928.1 BIG/ATPase V1 complex, subunit S1 family-containing protein [Strongyloides ratti]